MSKRIGFLVAAAILPVAGVAIAAERSTEEAVTLCAEKRSGVLKLSTQGRCAKGERKLVLPKTAPVGASGPPGPEGRAGSPGPVGSTGATGATGSAGKDGTPAELAPGPVQLVTEVGGLEPAARPDCETTFAVFCSYDQVHWTNYGNGYATVGYQRDAAGYVHLQGVARQQMGLGQARKEIFFLPPGYRPQSGTRRFAAPRCGDTTTYVEIQPSGAVEIEFDGEYCVSLDGIVFYP